MKAARRSPATEVVCWDEVPLPQALLPQAPASPPSLLPSIPLYRLGLSLRPSSCLPAPKEP